jgi:preprotein translocase subunit SecE
MSQRQRRGNPDGLSGDLAVEPEFERAERSGRQPRRRTTPASFAREVRDEMRQVAWPSRTDMVNYTAVVVTTLVVMIALIFLLNFAFGKGVLYLFQK